MVYEFAPENSELNQIKYVIQPNLENCMSLNST